jgi:hypothetical protein
MDAPYELFERKFNRTKTVLYFSNIINACLKRHLICYAESTNFARFCLRYPKQKHVKY